MFCFVHVMLKARRLARRSLIVCLAFLAVGRLVAAEYWLFAGQSNMNVGMQSKSIFTVLDKADPGMQRLALKAQKNGQPISFWQPQMKGGKQLAAAFASLTTAKAKLKAMVWQQGEANNRGWHAYTKDLRELIHRVREQAGDPVLPIYINQLGPHLFKADPMVRGRKRLERVKLTGFISYWNDGLMREAQRRFALSDDNIHIVNTMDLALGDGTIHLNKESHAEVGRRVGLLASGVQTGPIPMRVTRDAQDETTIHVHCQRVLGSLKLVDGWQQGFSLSAPVQVPSDLEQWPIDDQHHPTRLMPPDKLQHPVKASVRDKTTVVLTFSKPVPLQSLLHWCAAPGRVAEKSNDMHMTGVVDDSGIALVAAALLPVEQ